MFDQIVIAATGGVISAAMLGLLAWLRKSYTRFVSIDRGLQALGQAVQAVLARLDTHEARLDAHERLLLRTSEGVLRNEEPPRRAC